MVLAALVATVVGCASTPEPIGELASARTAIRNLDQADVRRFAPVDFDRAKTKLARADEALAKDENAQARRLAEESLADAELARAKASAARATMAADDLEQSIDVMRNEIERARTSR
jgi:hypothetical protein